MSVLIFVSSPASTQSQRDPLESTSIRECKKNYTESEGREGRHCRTWGEYDNLDFGRGFDAVLITIQARRDRIIWMGRNKRAIRIEMTLGTQEKSSCLVDIELIEKEASLMIILSSKAEEGQGPGRLCGFFEDLEKFIHAKEEAFGLYPGIEY